MMDCELGMMELELEINGVAGFICTMHFEAHQHKREKWKRKKEKNEGLKKS